MGRLSRMPLKIMRLISFSPFIGASLVAQLAKNLPAMQNTPSRFLVQEDPLEKGMATHSTILWASLVAQMVKNPHAVWETWVRSWVGKIPWTRERLPTPVVWPGEFNGQRSLSGYSRWGRKESDMTEWLSLFTFPHLQVGTMNQLPFTSENFNIVTKRCGESTVSASTLYKLLCSNDLWAALLAVCKVSYWYVYHKLLSFPSDSLVKKCLPMQKTRVLYLGWEDPLEKETAIHCSILAWEIPWTRRPGALQSMRSRHLTRLSGSTINVYYQWFTGFWSFFLLNFDSTKQLNGTPRINKRSDAPVNERK